MSCEHIGKVSFDASEASVHTVDMFVYPTDKRSHTFAMIVALNDLNNGIVSIESSFTTCTSVKQLNGIDITGQCANKASTPVTGWIRRKLQILNGHDITIKNSDDYINLYLPLSGEKIQKVIVQTFGYPMFFNCFSGKMKVFITSSSKV